MDEYPQNYEPYMPAPTPEKPKSKKGSMAVFLVACILFSGLAGYTGAYLGRNNSAEETEKKAESTKAAVIYQVPTGTGGTETALTDVAQVAAKVANSVVEITTETVVNNNRLGQYVTSGAGSGVILTEDGYIVTNNHVIEGASSITVRLKNGESYPATLVGTDEKTDIAVIRITATGLPPAVLGNSAELVVGETAVAVGNPLGELGGTVTSGIISALERQVRIDNETMTLLQTNAAINQGNSGGGLFNAKGELIGVVNAKSSGTGIEGLGFAIPIDTAKPVINQLIEFGYVKGRIDTGFDVIDLTSQEEAFRYRVSETGIYVLQITTGAEGFAAGDLLVSIDGTAIATLADYQAVLDSHKVGDVLQVTIKRNRTETTVSLTLKEQKPTRGQAT